MPNNSAEVKDKSITFKEIVLNVKEWFLFLKGKFIIIFICGCIGGLSGIGYAYFTKPLYTGVLSFVLEDDNGASSGVGGALGLASQLGYNVSGNVSGGVFSGNNLIDFMKSRSIIEKTLLNSLSVNGRQLSYAQYFIEINKWNEDWVTSPELSKISFPPNSSRASFSRAQDSVLEKIYLAVINEKLNISQKDKKVTIIIIEVKDNDELFAKNFTETIAQEVSDFYIETMSKKAKMNVAILQKQTDSIRAELNAVMTGAAIANDNTYNLNPAMNVNRVPSAKKQVDVQANTALLTQLIVNLEVAKSNLRKETPLIQVIDRPIYPLMKEKPGKFRSLLAGGMLAVFACMFYLVLRKLYLGLMMT